MNSMQYEVCLHHLKAHFNAAWNQSPVRLEVFADGEPGDSLTKFNGGSPVWDLSDQCYRFNQRIQFDLIEDNGTDEPTKIATFSITDGTRSCGAELADLAAGYSLTYTCYQVGVRIAA